MLILYYWPGASSVVPHIVLEEIGAPCERQVVNLAQGEHKSGAYLKINPHGKGPALAVDGMVLTENVAILTYLAKRFPETQSVTSEHNRRSALHINDGVVCEHR